MFNNKQAHISICYDLRATHNLINTAADANFLVHITDLSWFAQTPASAYLLALAQKLAMMTQKPLVYSANFGTSAFINHQRHPLATNTQANMALYHAIETRVGTTPLQNIGGEQMIAWLLFVVVCISGGCTLSRY